MGGGDGVSFAKALARGGRYHPAVEGIVRVTLALDTIDAWARGEGPA